MIFNYFNENIYYEEYEEGIPIVILHSLVCNIELMKVVWNQYKKTNNYKRIYIDLLGMGKSNKSSLKFVSSDKILEILSRFMEFD